MLLIKPDELRAELALAAANNDNIDLAVKFCKELLEIEPSTKTAAVFYKVALTLSNLVANGTVKAKHAHKTNITILELARAAVAYCDKSKYYIIIVFLPFT